MATLTEQPRTIPQALASRVERIPDEPFLKCGGDWLTNAALEARSAEIAGGLGRFTERGDRVAMIVPNRIEMLELFFACARLGTIQVPLNTFLKGEFLRHQLADSGARTLVVDEPGYRTALPVIAETHVERIVLLDDVDDPAAPCEVIRYEQLAGGGPAPERSVQPSDPLSILYTSGTTGAPKGCVLPNGYYTRAGIAFGEVKLIEPRDRIHTAFPLFHAGGQAIALMAALMNEGSVSYAREFSGSKFIRQAAEEQANVVWGVGPMGMAILAQPPSPDDTQHGLRLAMWVPMHPAHQVEFEERFNVSVISEMYGQTECQPATVVPGDGSRNRASTGRASPHLEVVLVDDGDRQVPVGAVGEIAIRPREPDCMFLGYWRNPEATLEAFRNLWYHTGDYGCADEDGFIRFVDRKKDALRRRGENVSSLELEAAIVKHPAVGAAAVIPVPSPLGEDDILACLVCEPGTELTPEQLFPFFKENLPYFAIPRYVRLRDALPVTQATSRVQKHVLKEEGVTPDTWDLEALGLIVAKEDRRG